MSSEAKVPQIVQETIGDKILGTELMGSGETLVKVENGAQRDFVWAVEERGDTVFISQITVLDEDTSFDMIYYFIVDGVPCPLLISLDKDTPRTTTISDLLGSYLYENEIWEMFGVEFDGIQTHKVFLPEDWDRGFPMRKSFTFEGDEK